ncbi:alpha/beta hydrolase [Rhizobium sp. GR12]|uniref:alpha/beta hydrolase n=1 Tax=Rhizobium sp. GR12 TaxID=3053925 RepID=UPI002FBEB7DE
MRGPERVTKISAHAGFHFRVDLSSPTVTKSVVLLHGSGRAEDDLIPFGLSVFADAVLFSPRGCLPWEDGFAFFRRTPDRQIDMDDLAKRAERLCNFLDFVANETGHTPLLAGYSNGAIVAAETIRQNRELSQGAILLRPLSPCPDRNFPPLAGYPALLIAAENDQRREPSDAPYLAGQLEKAGADIVLRVVAGDHGWADDGADIRICKHWLHDHYKG